MEYCKWKYDERHDKWDTECGQGHQFMEGGLRENNHVFCPYCGRRTEAITTCLKCDTCGKREFSPYDEGDECLCGGKLKTTRGE